MSEFLAVEDEMPSPSGGRGTYDGLREKVQKIVKDPDLHHKAVAVAAYDGEKGRARANSAVQSLRNTYGTTNAAMGLTFAVRSMGDDGRVGVWVHHDPKAIQHGALDEHKAKVKAQAAKTKAKKAAAEKAAAA